MKLYSKEELTRTVSSMKKSGRMAHGFLFTGEAGSGRFFSAKFTAMSLMCDSPGGDGLPCGECRQCRRIGAGTHPDVIVPEGEGKSGSYSVGYIREKIAADAYTAPNDCSCKVYIIRGCEKLSAIAQDSLLKIVEEPPPHVYFIFTALNRDSLLPTLLSRVVTVNIGSCAPEQTREALTEMQKYSDEDIRAAVKAFGTNIGSAEDFLEKGSKFELFTRTQAVCRAVIGGDGYTVLKILSAVRERGEMLELIDMLDRVIRDSAVTALAGDRAEILGCCPDEARELSHMLTQRRMRDIHAALGQARYLCGTSVNANLNAEACVLAAELCGNG